MSENTSPTGPDVYSAGAPQPVGYQQPPTQPGFQPMLESEARTWAMLVHLIAVGALMLSGGTLGFVAPLVIWLIFRQRSALVDFHGKQNLNLQLTLIVVVFSAVVLGFIMFGFGLVLTVPLAFAYGIYAIVISIIAGLKANDGEYYRIGFVIRFVR